MRVRLMLLTCVALCVTASAGRAETPEEWVQLGARVHGGFGAFIPVGIKIGLDALQRLDAKPREVAVTYYDNGKAPCACVADGVMLAVVATPGQRTLQIAAEKAPAGMMAVVVVRHKQTGASVRYEVSESLLAQLAEWNRGLAPRARFDAVMQADEIFTASVTN